MRKSTASLLLLLALPAGAATIKPSGYLKDFTQYSRGLLDQRPYWLSTARARLTLDGEHRALRAHADYDHQVAWGSFFRTADFRAFGYAPPSPWLDAQGTISTGTTNGYGHGLYRGWIGIEDERGALRAGRQRIAWGTGKIWNPTDVLNPYDPAAIERDERRGVDAVYARAALGALAQAELVWAPRDAWVEHNLLARGRGHFGGWDAALLGGKVAGSTGSMIVGGDFAGTALEGTLHGEWAYFMPESRAPYWKAGLGWDYTFASETSVPGMKDAAFVVEAFHAGNGQTDVRRYDFLPLRQGREVSVARNYAGGSFSKDLHPLLKLEMFALANADDASTFFSPSLVWNALDDLYLTASLLRFGGERRTEYGRSPNQAVLVAQYYF